MSFAYPDFQQEVFVLPRLFSTGAQLNHISVNKPGNNEKVSLSIKDGQKVIKENHFSDWGLLLTLRLLHNTTVYTGLTLSQKLMQNLM